MANLKLSLTDDCRYLSYTIHGEANTVGANGQLDIYVNGGDPVTTIAGDNVFLANWSAGSNVDPIVLPSTQTISLEEYNLTEGIITVILTDGEGNTAAGAILNSCDLKCCLAKKVLALSTCDCDDPKCDSDLAVAQKLFLFLKSIETMLSIAGQDPNILAGIVAQAIDIYNSAKSLCESDCGCNC